MLLTIQMDNRDNETMKFDCSRGCTVTQDKETGEYDCNYRQGCCKLESYDWLKGVTQEQYKDLFEVRFKNTRKGIYVNASGQGIKTGDLVIVEAANGHDLGIVTLEGPIVGRQMKCKGIDPETTPLKKIYRRAKPFDIAKWQDAIAREQDTMIQARRIAAELGLDMKIGDVEFQGDGTKAIFYYIADGRVDFRQLIKIYAEEFRIRIDYEVANYLDAQTRIPKVSEPLEFMDGPAYLVKTDILQETMYFSYEKGSLTNLYALHASEVREIIMMNRNGEKPESLKADITPEGPQFISAVGDDSITRFDKPKKAKNRGRNRNGRKARGPRPAKDN